MPSAWPASQGEALAAEREFVKTLGGFVLGIAGAELVIHERVPLPRFNYVEVRSVGPGRQSAFFERALDHYFQRALRPTFRVPLPEPPHIASGLERFGFRRRNEPRVLLFGVGPSVLFSGRGLTVRAARPPDLAASLALWAEGASRGELQMAVEVAWRHPNEGERLTPFVAVRADRVIAAALRYEHEGTVGLHLIATAPGEEGQGAASALVATALDATAFPPPVVRFLWADSSRLEARLRTLGFTPVLTFAEYELPPGTELAFPPAGPVTPPRWRPPRPTGARAGA